MSTFWPNGLEISDTQSPRQILETARTEWEANSGGALSLVLQDAESKSGYTMIIVHAKHTPSKRTATLFSIVHRPNAPYPVTIQPEDENLPVLLQKTYYHPGIGVATLKLGFEGHQVTNKWVSDSPSEFRTKLIEVFNLGVVKAFVLNLVADAPVAQSGENTKATEEKAPEE